MSKITSNTKTLDDTITFKANSIIKKQYAAIMKESSGVSASLALRQHMEKVVREHKKQKELQL